MVLLAAVNSVIGNILISKSQKNTSLVINIYSLEFIFGCFFFLVNLGLFAYALKFVEVSSAYPVLSGTSFILLALFSSLFLKDQLNLTNYMGMLTITFGIYLILK